MYGKLIDGNLRIAPKMLHIGSDNVWNPTGEQYVAAGYKPVEFTEMPEAPEGYTYESGWEEQETAIVQTWTPVELPPEEMSAEEALEIILGGEIE